MKTNFQKVVDRLGFINTPTANHTEVLYPRIECSNGLTDIAAVREKLSPQFIAAHT